ncbi:unnamed protein product, partial [Rotaria magnacalcarata]
MTFSTSTEAGRKKTEIISCEGCSHGFYSKHFTNQPDLSSDDLKNSLDWQTEKQSFYQAIEQINRWE